MPSYMHISHVHTHMQGHSRTHTRKSYFQGFAIKMVNPQAWEEQDKKIPGGSFSQQAPRMKCMNKLQS